MPEIDDDGQVTNEDKMLSRMYRDEIISEIFEGTSCLDSILQTTARPHAFVDREALAQKIDQLAGSNGYAAIDFQRDGRYYHASVMRGPDSISIAIAEVNETGFASTVVDFGYSHLQESRERFRYSAEPQLVIASSMGQYKDDFPIDTHALAEALPPKAEGFATEHLFYQEMASLIMSLEEL